ncbi:hypothetical protein ACIA8G_01245 [Lentzea sp. NPDC051213]|uniref:hypothetical protein n=1 Tax=Lentzea sp. NPDC051213 TaxID=3364126 RepID=UPI0037A756EE
MDEGEQVLHDLGKLGVLRDVLPMDADGFLRVQLRATAGVWSGVVECDGGGGSKQPWPEEREGFKVGRQLCASEFDRLGDGLLIATLDLEVAERHNARI